MPYDVIYSTQTKYTSPNEEYIKQQLWTLQCAIRISIAAKFRYNLPIIPVDIRPLRN